MKPCPSCGGDCGYTQKKGCQYKSNEFNPDWNGTADMVDEIQRIANRIEELETKEWLGLTDKEIEKIWLETLINNSEQIYLKDFAYSIEAKLQEKNYVKN